jgi:carbon storage regulator
MALVLCRRECQRILIGNRITIEVIKARGGEVRLAITAPREIRVDREEIRMRIEREHHNREES